ncbi:membrane protein E3 RID-beta [Simian adenovirus DM-2014]|uniref:Membrane protein E3 RID-beta n=1 Tax=Simian adenovirus DM-2014 TaxID=1560346 RepID=A0A097IWC7_9ADEN|nr:membrane protein E3 RID-beta [Simian adenovirus DM-2014]AIT70993.1 membrane protein E3 RID-beta [Simian adenovirus DM-2014]
MIFFLAVTFLPLAHCCRFTFSKLWTIKDCYPIVPINEDPWLFAIVILTAIIALFTALYLKKFLPFPWITDDLLDYPSRPPPNIIPLQNLLNQLPPPPPSPSTCSYFHFTDE